MLKDLDTIAVLPAADISRASDFYQSVLRFDAPESLNEENLLFSAGNGTRFLVYKTEAAGSARNTQLSWETGNIEAEMADLRGRGVVFEDYDMPGLVTENGLVATPVGKAAWFKDSEGNILNILQRG